MSKVFISYERASEAATRRVAEALRAAGHDVWTDAQLPAHRAYSEVIEERLAAADAVVVLWSGAAERSQWVRAEAEYARERGKLVQAVLDDTLPPMPFNQTQCADLKAWKGDRRSPQWRKVLQSLEQLTEAAAAGAPPPVAPSSHGPSGASTARRIGPRTLAAIVGGLVVVALGAWVLNAQRQRSSAVSDPRTVVLPFKALSADPAAQNFAAAAPSEFAGKLNESRVQTVTATQAGAADYAISGTVQAAGGKLHVRASLEDAHAGVTLWSAEFERPTAEADALRSEVGWRLGDVMASAVMGRRSSRGRLAPAELGMFIKARDALAEGEVQPFALFQELTRRAPNFAPGHASMCLQRLGNARTASAVDFGRQRDIAVSECRMAVKLDPEIGAAYRGLSYATDGRNWAQREAVLRSAETKSPDVDAALGELLAQVGRQDEGIRLLQAVAVKQSWTIHATTLGYALLMSDRPEETPEYIAKRLALRPDDTDMRGLALMQTAYRGSPDEGLAILDDPNRRPQDLPPMAIKAYRAFLTARRSGSATDRQTAIATILETLGANSLLQHYAVPMLAKLGDLDDAFRVAQDYAGDPQVLRYGVTLQTTFLFGPETRAMRADPRFIPIVKSVGLLDYWRSSGAWPDFCVQEPKSVCAEMKRQAGSR